MNQNQVNSAIRSSFKIIGTLLAAHGAMKAASFFNAEDIIGAVLALVGLWASFNTHSCPPASSGTLPQNNSSRGGSLLPLFLLAGIFFFLPAAHAQTNTPPAPAPVTATNVAPPDFFSGLGISLQSLGLSSNPSNYAVAMGYGHSLKGNQSAAWATVVENVNNNLGVIVGVDTLWGGGKIGSANIVAGGLTVKTVIHPLKFISSDTNSWFQTFKAIPFAIVMVGTPINGTGSADGGLASIARAGANFDIYNVNGWQIGAGVDYGNRTGAGNYSGNWIDVLFSVRKGF